MYFLKQVALSTLNQLFLIFGVLFIWGLVLYLLARFTRRTFQKSLGPRAEIYLTAWVGTSIHELGHAIFCILFNHKILQIKLFSPDERDGTLGFVNHSYNPRSLYQQIGNLFIGIGPIIFGSLVLYALILVLVPSGKEVISTLKSSTINSADGFTNILRSSFMFIKNILTTLFQANNFNHASFYIFLFLSICISSHMELSPSDIKSFGRGLFFMVIVFFLINTILQLVQIIEIEKHINLFSMDSLQVIIVKLSALMGSILILSAIISATNFMASYITLSILNIFRGKSLINPIV